MNFTIKQVKAETIYIFSASFIPVALYLPPAILSITIAVFFLFTLFSFIQNPTTINLKNNSLTTPIFLYFIYALGILYSSHFSIAFTDIGRKIPLLLLPLSYLLVGKRFSESASNKVLFSFLLATIFCSIVCYSFAFYNVWINKSFFIKTIDRVYYYFAYIYLTDPVNIDPIYLSMFCNLALIISLKTPLIKSSTLRTIVVFYIAVFIILISSKIGILTLILILICWLLTSMRKIYLAVSLSVALGSLITFSIYKFPFLKDRFTTSLHFDYSQEFGHLWNSTSYRLAIWSCSVETIAASPIWGYGTGDGQVALQETYREKNFIWGLRDSFNPHNQFFATMLDIGIPGLIVLFAMIALPFVSAFKQKDLILIGFVLIVLLAFLTESVLSRQKGIAFITFFYSFLLAGFTKTPDPKG
jgi:O-antigen ligase